MLCLPLFNAGCGLFEIDKDKQQAEQVQNIRVVDGKLSDVQAKIVDSLKDATKSDLETIYKIFSGAALYVENSSKLTKFSEVIKLILAVEEDYKWQTETYSKLTDVIEQDLLAKNYEDDKELDVANKKLVVDLFKEYSDAVLIVLKEKSKDK